MATKIAELGIGTAQSQPVSQEKLESIAQGWQPIETCPKDGSYFLGWSDVWEWQVIWWHELDGWAASMSNLDESDYKAYPFTFWMPLPAPPSLSDCQTKPAGVHPPARVTHLGAE